MPNNNKNKNKNIWFHPNISNSGSFFPWIYFAPEKRKKKQAAETVIFDYTTLFVLFLYYVDLNDSIFLCTIAKKS